MGIISDLYYGRLQPLGECESSSSGYIKTIEKLRNIEEEIVKQYPDGKDILDKYKDANATLNDIVAFENFERGYKFGARIIMAAMEP